MAAANLLAMLALPVPCGISLGCGITVFSNKLAVTSYQNASKHILFYDIATCEYISKIKTPQTLQSIHYDKSQNVYWGVAAFILQEISMPFSKRVFKFKPDGTVILSFDLDACIPKEDRFETPNWQIASPFCISLSIDKNEILVAYYSSFRIYKFSLIGEYIGFVDIPFKTGRICGITCDNKNIWLLIAQLCKPQTTASLLKCNSDMAVLERADITLPTQKSLSVSQLMDIEFDNNTFYPKKAIWVRGYNLEKLKLNQMAFACEI